MRRTPEILLTVLTVEYRLLAANYRVALFSTDSYGKRTGTAIALLSREHIGARRAEIAAWCIIIAKLAI